MKTSSDQVILCTALVGASGLLWSLAPLLWIKIAAVWLALSLGFALLWARLPRADDEDDDKT